MGRNCVVHSVELAASLIFDSEIWTHVPVPFVVQRLEVLCHLVDPSKSLFARFNAQRLRSVRYVILLLIVVEK